MAEEKQEVGRVTHYYPKIGVAVVQLRNSVNLGDRILVKGAITNFEQLVESMQIEHKDVQKADAGQSVGLKVKEKVRENDVVYKVG